MKKKVNVYRFSQLDKDVKEDLIRKAKDWLVDTRFEGLQEALYEYVSEQYGITLKNNSLDYSLSNCQGDGLSFKLLDLQNYPHFMQKVKGFLTSAQKKMLASMIKDDGFNVFSTGNTGRYCYAHKEQVTWDADCSLTIKRTELADIVTGLFGDVYIELCKELEDIGYSSYNVSDKDAIEHCSEYGNEEALYFSDGRIANSYLVKENK